MDAWIYALAALALLALASRVFGGPMEADYTQLQDVTHEKGGNQAYVRALLPHLPRCQKLRSVDAWRLPAGLRRQLVEGLAAAVQAGQLPELRSLTLPGIDAGDVETLECALGGVSELRVPQCEDAARVLRALPASVRALDVSGGRLAELAPPTLPAGLEELVLDGAEGVVRLLAPLLQSLGRGLRVLHLRRLSGYWDEPAVQELLQLLARSPELLELRLGSNTDLSDATVATVARAAAAAAPGLQVLDLGGTGAAGETAAAVAAAMGALPRLQELHMSNVCYGKDGVLAIADALPHVPQLRKLKLWTNRVPAAERDALEATIKAAAEKHTKVEGFKFRG